MLGISARSCEPKSLTQVEDLMDHKKRHDDEWSNRERKFKLEMLERKRKFEEDTIAKKRML